MQLAEFAENLLGSLVANFRHLYGNLDNLIAALILARVKNALFTHPELLSVLRARWNPEERAAVDGGHFDLCAQAGFADRHRDADLDIVAVPVEKRMLFHARGDVEVARWRAESAGIPFSRHA